MYNLVNVIRCFFYGDISPKSDPILYGQNVAELYTHFQHQYCNDGRIKMPLVINTHGWVKGTWQYSVSLLMQIDTWYLTRLNAGLMALVNHSFGHHTLVLTEIKSADKRFMEWWYTESVLLFCINMYMRCPTSSYKNTVKVDSDLRYL